MSQPHSLSPVASDSSHQQVVLLGVGHTNAHVLRMWIEHAPQDARLTCVSNFPTATYSGMLPGVLAGQYDVQQMTIDLERLCHAARARLIVHSDTHIDRSRRELIVPGEPPIRYDWLSVGVGSQPRMDAVATDCTSVVPLKPMQTLLTRLDQRLAELSTAKRAVEVVEVVVVGSGAGGVEVALCLPSYLDRRLGGRPWRMTVIGAATRFPGNAAAATARIVAREFQRRGVRVESGRRVVRASGEHLELDDGRKLAADLTLWATDAVAPAWFHRFDLPQDERGFLRIRPTLQSSGDERIFVVGDSAAWPHPGLPKAGVFAVREGPVLWENIRRALRGEPLRSYEPQPRFLKLLNLGDGRAIAEYAGLAVRGRWAWRWKDRIDRRFVNRFHVSQPPPSQK